MKKYIVGIISLFLCMPLAYGNQMNGGPIMDVNTLQKVEEAKQLFEAQKVKKREETTEKLTRAAYNVVELILQNPSISRDNLSIKSLLYNELGINSKLVLENLKPLLGPLLIVISYFFPYSVIKAISFLPSLVLPEDLAIMLASGYDMLGGNGVLNLNHLHLDDYDDEHVFIKARYATGLVILVLSMVFYLIYLVNNVFKSSLINILFAYGTTGTFVLLYGFYLLEKGIKSFIALIGFLIFTTYIIREAFIEDRLYKLFLYLVYDDYDDPSIDQLQKYVSHQVNGNPWPADFRNAFLKILSEFDLEHIATKKEILKDDLDSLFALARYFEPLRKVKLNKEEIKLYTKGLIPEMRDIILTHLAALQLGVPSVNFAIVGPSAIGKTYLFENTLTKIKDEYNNPIKILSLKLYGTTIFDIFGKFRDENKDASERKLGIIANQLVKFAKENKDLSGTICLLDEFYKFLALDKSLGKEVALRFLDILNHEDGIWIPIDYFGVKVVIRFPFVIINNREEYKETPYLDQLNSRVVTESINRVHTPEESKKILDGKLQENIEKYNIHTENLTEKDKEDINRNIQKGVKKQSYRQSGKQLKALSLRIAAELNSLDKDKKETTASAA
ncbi:MAG: hypothetical protein AAF380_02730 [Bacteroidota bacterium]